MMKTLLMTEKKYIQTVSGSECSAGLLLSVDDMIPDWKLWICVGSKGSVWSEKKSCCEGVGYRPVVSALKRALMEVMQWGRTKWQLSTSFASNIQLYICGQSRDLQAWSANVPSDKGGHFMNGCNVSQSEVFGCQCKTFFFFHHFYLHDWKWAFKQFFKFKPNLRVSSSVRYTIAAVHDCLFV